MDEDVESTTTGSDVRVDSEEAFLLKMQRLVELIRKSKHFVIYTGAGISTAANIPDFRGPGGLNSKGILGLKEHELDLIMPTYSHLVIKALLDKGVAKFLVTSNHDDLHCKAGTEPSQLAELFGNAYIEECLKCHTLYRRQVVTPNLGRKCDNATCGGRLVKTGVRFGGAVPEEPLRRATKNARKCDVALVLGSSMTVSPFCDLPKYATDAMAVVSIQPTPADHLAGTIKINATCDQVMRYIAKEFDINVQDFEYKQQFFIACLQNAQQGVDVKIHGRRNEPVSCIDSAKLMFLESKKVVELEKSGLILAAVVPTTVGAILQVDFVAEYGESPQKYDIPPMGTETEHFFVHSVTYKPE